MTNEINYDQLFSKRIRSAAPAAGFKGGTPAHIIPLAFGLPDPASFPADGLRQAACSVLDTEAAEALGYGSAHGVQALVRELLAKLQRHEGITAGPDQMMITNGSTVAIEIVAKLFFDPGDTILVESPTFLGAVRVFRHCYLNTECVAMDGGGIRMDLLEQKLAEMTSAGTRPKLLYTMPTYHNPTGITMPIERRKELLALADKHGIMLLEDDAYGDLRYSGDRIPSLYELDENGRVIRIGTLSKILAAGLRLGWILGPKGVVSKMAATKVDTGTNPFSSYVAAAFYRAGLIDPHIERLRQIYKPRRDAMLAALEKYAPAGCQWTKPDGGFFVWLEVPTGIDASALLPEAEKEGVNYVSGDACNADGSGRNYIRLSFSFVEPDGITEGIRRLCTVLDRAITRA